MGNFGKPWSVDDLTNLLKKRPEARIPAHSTAKLVKTRYSQSSNDSEPSAQQALTAQGPVGVALLEAVTGRKAPKENRKVRNAQKITDEKGRKFDSRLEMTMAQALDAAGISYTFQHTYTLQDGFRYNGKAVRPMTLTVDFLLPQFNLIIDSKGWSNDVAPVKYKLLKRKLLTDGTPHEIQMPRNKKECDALILELLSRK